MSRVGCDESLAGQKSYTGLHATTEVVGHAERQPFVQMATERDQICRAKKTMGHRSGPLLFCVLTVRARPEERLV